MNNTYTCKGKGGLYELVGIVYGAGSLRGQKFTEYREVSSDVRYVREPADFNNRMELVEAATPAATTSGAAGTIARWHPRWDVPTMVRQAVGYYVTYTDHAAAVAAAREEADKHIKILKGYVLDMEDSLRQISDAVGITVEDVELTIARVKELARLRAAPVVGEAVKPADDEHARLIAAEDKGYASGRRVGLVDGASIIRELYVNHVHGDGASGLLARCEQAEQVLYGLIDTAPHAAKEAGKVDGAEIVAAVKAAHALGRVQLTYVDKAGVEQPTVICRDFLAALARTTNKEGS